jgi:hypothetical protein
MKIILIKYGMIVLGMFSYFLIGNFVLFPLFISDECFYHSNEIPLYINILFDFPSVEGYHPVPTRFGYLIFGIIGYFVGKRILEKK